MNPNPRVLQVIGRLTRGGIETWLMQLLREFSSGAPSSGAGGRVQMDFLVHSDEPGHYDDEARKLGAKILVCAGHRNPVAYSRKLQRLLHEHGPYDVVHSHVQFMNGLVLRAAAHAGVPERFAHSHVSCAKHGAATPLRRLYYNIMRSLIQRHATRGLGCSRVAGADLFGRFWETESKNETYYAGIDLQPFRASVDRSQVRRELGIPKSSFVVGHIGRFEAQKNHDFLIQIGNEILRERSDAHLVLVGEGPDSERIRSLMAQGPFAERVHFLGSRPDVPQLLKGLFDLFVLPSLYEGLPHSALEAQAAGVPVLLSTTITPEVEVIPELIDWGSLDHSPQRWAQKGFSLVARASLSPEEAYARLLESDFNLRKAMMKLEELYRSPVEPQFRVAA